MIVLLESILPISPSQLAVALKQYGQTMEDKIAQVKVKNSGLIVPGR